MNHLQGSSRQHDTVDICMGLGTVPWAGIVQDHDRLPTNQEVQVFQEKSGKISMPSADSRIHEAFTVCIWRSGSRQTAERTSQSSQESTIVKQSSIWFCWSGSKRVTTSYGIIGSHRRVRYFELTIHQEACCPAGQLVVLHQCSGRRVTVIII